MDLTEEIDLFINPLIAGDTIWGVDMVFPASKVLSSHVLENLLILTITSLRLLNGLGIQNIVYTSHIFMNKYLRQSRS